MKLFDTSFTKADVKNGLEDLSDLMRFQINRSEKSQLLQELDFDDDDVFLEPSLFFLFSQMAKTPDKTAPLEQIISTSKSGFLNKSLMIHSDGEGIVHLPSIGYLIVQPNQTYSLTIESDNSKIQLSQNGQDIPYQFKPFQYLKGTSIKLLEYQSELLTNYQIETVFEEPISKTVKENEKKLNEAYSILKEVAPYFSEMVEMVTKDITLFRSPNHFSMASINHFGSAFFNLGNEIQNEPFFIEDIAHQCGHIIFYTLTIEAHEFFKVPKDTPLKNFCFVSYEQRDIYGCFHGLFTYSTIINCLDLVIESNEMRGDLLIETYARLSYFLIKFRKDLVSMEDNSILSERGFEYFDMFQKSYSRIYKKYKQVTRSFDFSNQTYLFSWKAFKELNETGNFNF